MTAKLLGGGGVCVSREVVDGCYGVGGRGGGCWGRLSGPGGAVWSWHVKNSEDTSMFGPYMMLHVLFFLAVLWDITEDKDVSALYVCTPTDPEGPMGQWSVKKKKKP